MWVIAEYEMVTLFSLKASTATGSGAKSLLVPTPYAFKMALLDAMCRTRGVAAAKDAWDAIRDSQVAVSPPEMALVTNLFTKVLKPRRGEIQPGQANMGPFQQTIAFREYVQHSGLMRIAFGVTEGFAPTVAGLVAQISYLGKRGGFVQLAALPTTADELPGDFLVINGDQNAFAVSGVVQVLDDCGPSLTFERASIYTGERVSVGKDRVIRHIVLPYRLIRSSKSFTLYERIPMGA